MASIWIERVAWVSNSSLFNTVVVLLNAALTPFRFFSAATAIPTTPCNDLSHIGESLKPSSI